MGCFRYPQLIAGADSALLRVDSKLKRGAGPSLPRPGARAEGPAGLEGPAPGPLWPGVRHKVPRGRGTLPLRTLCEDAQALTCPALSRRALHQLGDWRSTRWFFAASGSLPARPSALY